MEQDDHVLGRRAFLQWLSGLGAALYLKPYAVSAVTRPAIKKAIPSTGELLPVIGMGSWKTFDVGNDPGLPVR